MMNDVREVCSLLRDNNRESTLIILSIRISFKLTTLFNYRVNKIIGSYKSRCWNINRSFSWKLFYFSRGDYEGCLISNICCFGLIEIIFYQFLRSDIQFAYTISSMFSNKIQGLTYILLALSFFGHFRECHFLEL